MLGFQNVDPRFHVEGVNTVGILVWDTGSLSWIKQTPISSGGGGAVTIADGADATQGSIADSAITSDAPGTISAKLRGLVKWAYERMPVSLGQKTSADSFPVVVASDQSDLPASVKRNAGVISAGNSSTATLGNGGIFTGTGADVLDYSTITVAIFSDVASATDGVSFQWSTDNVNWDHVETYTLQANKGRSFNLTIRARFFRIVYTNDTTPQTTFRLQTIFEPMILTPRKEPVTNPPDNDEAALFTQSVIVGHSTAMGGALVQVKVSPSGAVQVGGAVTVSGTVDASGSLVSTKTALAAQAPAVATVGVASGAALVANANRKGSCFRNLSTSGQRISLGINNTAILDSGVTLFPGDAAYMDEYSFSTAVINAIASAAGAKLAIQEYQ